MDKVEKYRQIIRKILEDHASLSHPNDPIETQVICDTEHDHYQLAYVGWKADRRTFGPVLHFDIKEGKIWVQYNGTEAAIGQTLVELGVPTSDIVLGFRSPFKRQFTPYAVE